MVLEKLEFLFIARLFRFFYIAAASEDTWSLILLFKPDMSDYIVIAFHSSVKVTYNIKKTQCLL